MKDEGGGAHLAARGSAERPCSRRDRCQPASDRRDGRKRVNNKSHLLQRHMMSECSSTGALLQSEYTQRTTSSTQCWCTFHHSD